MQRQYGPELVPLQRVFKEAFNQRLISPGTVQLRCPLEVAEMSTRSKKNSKTRTTCYSREVQLGALDDALPLVVDIAQEQRDKHRAVLRDRETSQIERPAEVHRPHDFLGPVRSQRGSCHDPGPVDGAELHLEGSNRGVS